MPIVTVEAVSDADAEFPRGLAAQLADAAAEICGSGPGELWLRLRALPKGQYAESGGSSFESLKPVFVTLLYYKQPETQERKRIAASFAKQFASILSRPPENIHILFEPEACERIALGGKLLD